MAATRNYDCIILGSGQAGTPLALAYAKAGLKTALVEKSHLGGCCVNEGCTPTKTMVASGRIAHLTRRADEYGVNTPDGSGEKVIIDMAKVRQRKRNIVASFRGGSEGRLEKSNVDILMGEASFTGPKTVLVKLNSGDAEVSLAADTIFINTGERPVKPDLNGVEGIPAERVLDSTSIQELGEVPTHLVVLGGGPIGLEFGQLFRRLGAAVTIVQRTSQLLPREDEDVAATLLEILRDDGITVHLKASATSVTKSSSGSFDLAIRTEDQTETTISGSHLLFAAGRTPNTDMLNLSAASISSNSRGYITTNERLETNVAGVYAIGDVKGPPAFTHISYDDFRIVQANVLNKGVTALTTTNRFVPYVTYTDPQLGHVGLHEKEARAKYPNRKIQIAKMPMSYVARGLETDETRGVMKAIVDGTSGEILGFTCLGVEGGELMSMVQLAMMGGLKYQSLRDATFAHPTWAESLNNLWGFLE
ncbi:MAG: hypothetical protein M1825_000831 [Sarcosagium campestre]|nr:MAG: hypothetical protein M1825_000831 [Sarcosagium campestre]